MKINTFCEYPFTRIRVTSNGNIAMCCFQRFDSKIEELQDPYIGNIFENNFDDIWFGSVASSIREETLEGRLHSKCQVPDCPFNLSKPPFKEHSVIYNEYPTFLEIDLPNTHCNVGGMIPSLESPACVMCDRSDPKFEPDQDLLFEVLSRIKHIVPNLTQIHVAGVAEPIYRHREDGWLLFDVLDVLDFDDHYKNIVVSLMTNGVEFDSDVRKMFFDRVERSVVSFSIDACSPETYKKIRILNCFETVLENFYFFSKERDKRNHFLIMHNNINTMNLHEVVGMVHMAHAGKVDYLEFNPTGGFNEAILVSEKNCGQFKKAQDQIAYECHRLKVPLRFIKPLDLGMTNRLSIL